MAQYINLPETPFHFYINDDPMKTVENLIYLGNVISSDYFHDLAIQRRINLASKAFDRLRERD